jgi:hypothetical protein
MVDRRNFLAAAGVAAMSFSELRSVLAKQAPRDMQGANPKLSNVKALVFDTFGTVVDWRSSIAAEGMAWGKAKGLDINWVDFAAAGASDTTRQWKRCVKAKSPGPGSTTFTA